MPMMMKVEILCRELIKPHTATPPSFRNYNISLIDEVSPNMNVPTIFYFSAPDHPDTNIITNIKSTDPDTNIKSTGPDTNIITNIKSTGPDTNIKSIPSVYEHLKNSLSKVLSNFHPFAGRYNVETHSVDCSDQGAEFVEAKVDIRLDDLLNHRKDLKIELLNDFLPCPLGAVDEYTDPLLAVQVNAFSCGGFAVAVCISHRIADITTITSFVKAWAVAAKQELGDVDKSYVPMAWSFDSASLLPGQNLPCLPSGLTREKENIEIHKMVTKIFYFSDCKISSIREKAKGEGSSKNSPTRVQSVFGVIAKAIIDIHVANPENPKGYVVVEAVNMRGRTVPPLPKNQFGNMYLAACVQSVAGPEGVELPCIVDQLSSSVKRAVDACGVVLSLDKEGQTMLSQELGEMLKSLFSPDVYFAGTFSSWCNFSLYEADFGYGKPVWVSIANIPMKNSVVLVDEKSGGGIDAWVTLDESDMQKFIKHCDIRDVVDCN
ncbi:pelargonidin 3-O-(6-caffeoylglucoside) 5-O-(6-O-malonylglucoside) 4'''-malonyltransferase [Daucus carota subsp. sativus]|nr:PREDICTED: pelargonidin 3-O-(6-caffeoylglucoside) 5-O-(6-O-malonylglucoside) 4'''-malonyltransferase-like [Daucus carota subsp. sativus]